MTSLNSLGYICLNSSLMFLAFSSILKPQLKIYLIIKSKLWEQTVVVNLLQMLLTISVPHMVYFIIFRVHTLHSKMEWQKESTDILWSALFLCYLIHICLPLIGHMLFLQQLILSIDSLLLTYRISLLGKFYTSLNLTSVTLGPLVAHAFPYLSLITLTNFNHTLNHVFFLDILHFQKATFVLILLLIESM